MTSEAENRAVRECLVALERCYSERVAQVADDSSALLGSAPHGAVRRSEIVNQAAGAVDAVNWCRRVVIAAIAVLDDDGRRT